MIKTISENKKSFLAYFNIIGRIVYVKAHKGNYCIELLSGSVEVIPEQYVQKWKLSL